jgi:hypothetical protein
MRSAPHRARVAFFLDEFGAFFLDKFGQLGRLDSPRQPGRQHHPTLRLRRPALAVVDRDGNRAVRRSSASFGRDRGDLGANALHDTDARLVQPGGLDDADPGGQ